ncbi:MAG: hypothetical protein ACRC33_23650, partial [Gemmataceae bacterium]
TGQCIKYYRDTCLFCNPLLNSNSCAASGVYAPNCEPHPLPDEINTPEYYDTCDPFCPTVGNMVEAENLGTYTHTGDPRSWYRCVN